jgi:hypothetical protein
MDTETTVLYEIIEPDTNAYFFTKDYYEAVDYFEEKYMVFEKHITVSNPSLYTQVRQIVTVQWHLNPEYK